MRLFLCEKPSQGKDIGRILGATQRGEGCLNGSGVTVTWCIGHLVEAAAPEVYDAALKRWSLEQLPIIPQQWRVEVKPKTAMQFKVVKALLAKATHLVIATDADREGELIAREIIDLCGYRGPIERLWLSALNDASIRSALAKLRPAADTLPMYYSALARSRADWLVGMNLSRLFTVLGRQAGYDGVLSVGRVQTPTLKLVVDRDREIAAFVSVPYWAIDVSLSAGGQTFTAQWVAPDASTDDAGRCLQQPVAQQAAQQIRAAGSAQVVSVETERVREGPPLLFDLGTLQEVCSKQLGLDVQETLEIAQALYETHKATTYPRSDSGYLPESMFAEVPTVLDSLVKTDPTLAPIMGQLDRSHRSRAWNDGKVTAHHGIIPTLEPANLSAMSEKEQAVYRLIRAHYLAQFLPHHEFERRGLYTPDRQHAVVAGLPPEHGEQPAEVHADEPVGARARQRRVIHRQRLGRGPQLGERGADGRIVERRQPQACYGAAVSAQVDDLAGDQFTLAVGIGGNDEMGRLRQKRFDDLELRGGLRFDLDPPLLRDDGQLLQRPALERRVIDLGCCRFDEMADAPGDRDAGAVEAAFTALCRAEIPTNILALGGLLAQEQPHIRPSDFRGSLSCWNRGCRSPPGATANKSQAVVTTFTGWNGSGGDSVQPGCAGREPRFSGARGSQWT